VTFEQPDARHALLVVEGEIDTLTAGSLERALTELLEDRPEVLVVDLTAVTFLASSGLAVLIRRPTRRASDGCGWCRRPAPCGGRWRSPVRTSFRSVPGPRRRALPRSVSPLRDIAR
jgi:hypothetical protein